MTQAAAVVLATKSPAKAASGAGAPIVGSPGGAAIAPSATAGEIHEDSGGEDHDVAEPIDSGTDSEDDEEEAAKSFIARKVCT